MSKNYFLKDPNFVKNIILNVLISLLSVMPIIIWLNIDKAFYKYATAEMACFFSLFFILIGFFIGLAYHWLLHKTNGVNKQLHG